MHIVSCLRRIACAILIPSIVILFPFASEAQEKTKEMPQAATRIAVIPFQAILPQDGSSTVQCPICGSVNASGGIVKGAERTVHSVFTDKLMELKKVEILPDERVAGIYQRTSADSLKQPLIKIVQKVGNEVHADVVAVGFVYRYSERVGYNYSAERPASVAFEIHLISVRDGTTLWRGIFDKTQKSLMEDVFQVSSFFKGGAKWLTAHELTKLGVDEVFKTFSGFEP